MIGSEAEVSPWWQRSRKRHCYRSHKGAVFGWVSWYFWFMWAGWSLLREHGILAQEHVITFYMGYEIRTR